MFKMSLAEKRFSFLMILENMYVILFFNFFFHFIGNTINFSIYKTGENYFQYIFLKEAVEIN